MWHQKRAVADSLCITRTIQRDCVRPREGIKRAKCLPWVTQPQFVSSRHESRMATQHMRVAFTAPFHA